MKDFFAFRILMLTGRFVRHVADFSSRVPFSLGPDACNDVAFTDITVSLDWITTSPAKKTYSEVKQVCLQVLAAERLTHNFPLFYHSTQPLTLCDFLCVKNPDDFKTHALVG